MITDARLIELGGLASKLDSAIGMIIKQIVTDRGDGSTMDAAGDLIPLLKQLEYDDIIEMLAVCLLTPTATAIDIQNQDTRDILSDLAGEILKPPPIIRDPRD